MPRCDLIHGPARVLSDQFIHIQRSLSQRGQVLLRADIAEHHADIAQEGGAFDALDRALAKQLAELVIGQGEEVAKLPIEDGLTGLEGGFVRELGKAVPRTGGETVVSAIQAIADGLAELDGDAALVLDGQIGNAAPCVHAMRGGDRIRGTGIHTACALAAQVFG